MSSLPRQIRSVVPGNTVCLNCRQRKIKCDRRRPICGFCSKSGFECQYPHGQHTPGLRAGYVSKLEARIDDLEREFLEFKEKISGVVLHSRSPNQSPSVDGYTAKVPCIEKPRDDISITSLLSQARLTYYCTTWFEQYHSWFPILHEPSIFDRCQRFANDPGAPVPLVLKAIAAVVIPALPCPSDMIQMQLEKWLLSLEDEILLAAIHNLSLQSLQALLILTIPVFGAGRIIEFYNLIAVCKRISTQLGLRDLVNYHATNFGVASAIPPRILFIPVTAVEREENIRAFWVTEAFDSTSTLGAAWHLSLTPSEPAASIPCDEEVWRYPESVLAAYFFGSTDAPSAFSLFVRLATNELWHVHNFLQQSYNQEHSVDHQQRKVDCDAVYQRLMSWHSDFESVLSIRSSSYVDLFSTGEGTAQHSNSILIHCTIHSAVISLYQRFIFPVDGISDSNVCWTGAAERCLSSCDALAIVMRGVGDPMLETINPHVIFCIFIAARFYIIYARASELPMSEKLYLLIYALTISGRRWLMAKQLRMVLETAVAENRSESVRANRLPIEFYDLQYLSWDIHEAVRKWALSKDGASADVESRF